MCTRVSPTETERKRKTLKPKNNIGWKIVKVKENGDYVSSQVRHWSYTKTGENVAIDMDYGFSLHSSDTVKYDGVFHLFASRNIARTILHKYLELYPSLLTTGNKFRVVKVHYKKKDFVCAGTSDSIAPPMADTFAKFKFDALCVEKFKFAE